MPAFDVLTVDEALRNSVAVACASRHQGQVGLFCGDSRCDPDPSHVRFEDRWTSIVAGVLGLDQRNFGKGGSTVIGHDFNQPWPRMLAYIMGDDYGPGEAFDSATTNRKFPAALMTLVSCYNEVYKRPIASNPAMHDTYEAGVEALVRLARADYAFKVGSSIVSARWTFGAGWSASALNSSYGVGPTTRLQASGDGSFSFTCPSSWPGGKLTVYVWARDTRRCRIRAKIGSGSYIATYDSTGGTAGLPALGTTGNDALTPLTVTTSAGAQTVNFDVDQITGQCTIMGATLEVGDIPAPLVLLLDQPTLPQLPDPDHPEVTQAEITEMNTRLANVADTLGDGRVVVVPVTSVITGAQLDFHDNVHYNNRGNKKVADIVLKAVSGAGLKSAFARSDISVSGPPPWKAAPGDRVWDHSSQRWWVQRDDPLLATGDDNRYTWMADGGPSAATTITGISYELDYPDQGAVFVSDAADDQTITVPAFADVPFPVGIDVEIIRIGAPVTIAEAVGVTIHSRGNLRNINGVGGKVTLRNIGEDVWSLRGDLDDSALDLLTSEDVQTWADSRYHQQLTTRRLLVPVVAKVGLMVVGPSRGALAAALAPKGWRMEAQQDGDVRALIAHLGTLSGNLAFAVYDTGDASAGNRTLLWGSDLIDTTSGYFSNQWMGTPVDPGAGALPVTAGQQLDVVLIADNTTLQFVRTAGSVSNLMRLPDAAGEFDTDGGAHAKLTVTYPTVTNTGSTVNWDATVAAANVTYTDVVPIIAGAVLQT